MTKEEEYNEINDILDEWYVNECDGVSGVMGEFNRFHLDITLTQIISKKSKRAIINRLTKLLFFEHFDISLTIKN